MQNSDQQLLVVVAFRTHRPNWPAESLTCPTASGIKGTSSTTNGSLQVLQNSSLGSAVDCCSYCSYFKWSHTCLTGAKMINSGSTCFLQMRFHLPLSSYLCLTWPQWPGRDHQNHSSYFSNSWLLYLEHHIFGLLTVQYRQQSTSLRPFLVTVSSAMGGGGRMRLTSPWCHSLVSALRILWTLSRWRRHKHSKNTMFQIIRQSLNQVWGGGEFSKPSGAKL